MLPHAIAVINGKGGVGKTTSAVNIAGIAALSGYRVLLVDLDPQTNTSNDLGFDRTPHADGLLRALTLQQHLPVLRDVRPGLDVIPAGQRLGEWTVHAALAHRSNPRDAPELTLARRLHDLAGDYDLILFDCPPGSEELQLLALAAAHATLIPFTPDRAGIEGLEEVADRVERARLVNPDLELLGAFLFGVAGAAKRVRADALERVTKALGEDALLTASVRFLQAPAVGARNRGQLAHEYEQAAEEQAPFYAALRAVKEGRSKQVPRRLASTASTLAGDFQRLTTEVLTRLAALNEASAVTA